MSNTESRSYFGLIRRSSEKMDILGFFARIKMTLTGNAALTVIRAGRSPTSLIRGPNRADLARVAAGRCPTRMPRHSQRLFGGHAVFLFYPKSAWRRLRLPRRRRVSRRISARIQKRSLPLDADPLYFVVTPHFWEFSSFVPREKSW